MQRAKLDQVVELADGRTVEIWIDENAQGTVVIRMLVIDGDKIRGIQKELNGITKLAVDDLELQVQEGPLGLYYTTFQNGKVGWEIEREPVLAE